MPDLTISCKECGIDFIWNENEQGFYHQHGFKRPARCKNCRPKRQKQNHIVTTSQGEQIIYSGATNDWFIDQQRIQEFVDSIEKKKNYRREYELIFRHLVEEVGELSAQIWEYEKSSQHIGVTPEWIGAELIDIISLCVYLATVFNIDLNEIFPQRMRAVAEKYGVEAKI